MIKKEIILQFLDLAVIDFIQQIQKLHQQYTSMITKPGPGSYKVDTHQKKKAKYIKIKKDFYDSNFAKPAIPESLIGD